MNPINATIRTRSLLHGGHFRGSVYHGEESKDWPPGTFTERQLDMLRADPNLWVEVLEATASGQDTATGENAPGDATVSAPAADPAPADADASPAAGDTPGEGKPKKGKKE